MYAHVVDMLGRCVHSAYIQVAVVVNNYVMYSVVQLLMCGVCCI